MLYGAIALVAGYGVYGLSKVLAKGARKVAAFFDWMASPQTEEGLRRAAARLEEQRRALQRTHDAIDAEFREQ